MRHAGDGFRRPPNRAAGFTQRALLGQALRCCLSGCGGWIRTTGLQVMSLTRYRAALPRYNGCCACLHAHAQHHCLVQRKGIEPSGQLERLVTSPKVQRCETGAHGLTRTDDLRFTRALLFRLSYTGWYPFHGAPGESRTPRILLLRQARMPVPSPGQGFPIRLCPIAGSGACPPGAPAAPEG